MAGQKKFTKPQALDKLRHYCAYRERSHKEVRQKVLEWGFYPSEADQMVVQMIEENYLNEERFARAFVRGKFKLKKWGRKKIEQGLHEKGIGGSLKEYAFGEIEEAVYRETLEKLLHKKWESLKIEPNEFVRQQKVIRYALGKGYESELVVEAVNKISKTGE